jgi:hypothetical protein
MLWQSSHSCGTIHTERFHELGCKMWRCVAITLLQ